MRIRQPLIVSIVAMAVLGASLWLAARLLVRQFDTIELNQAADKATQAVRAMEADLNQLAVSTRDYAEWDDAQAYIAGSEPQFLQANFSHASLTGMEVDMVAILDRQGRLLYGATVDNETAQLHEGIDVELDGLVRALQPQIPLLRKQSSPQRLLRTNKGLLAFSMVEIARSDHSAPTGAAMFFGRYLDDDDVDRVRRTCEMNLQLRAPSAEDSARVPSATGTYAVEVDDDHLKGVALLRDWRGNPVASVEVAEARDIGSLGRHMTFILMSAIALLIASCLVLFNVMIERLRHHWEQHACDLLQQQVVERQLAEQQQQLRHVQEHDGLTGLPNREHLRAILPELMERADSLHKVLVLLHVDIDHFKHMNDISGPASGDRILQVIAQRLCGSTAHIDLVARVGGDEFMVVAAVEDGPAAFKALSQSVVAAIRQPIDHEDSTADLTASIGAAIYPHDGVDVDTLIKHTDIALVQAKERGRNCVQAFANDMNLRLSEQAFIEKSLRRALGTDQLFVEYQPVVDLHTGLLVSFEALVRWRHPERGVIPPARFIPIAERSELIVPLGAKVVRLVMAQLREWQQAGLTLAPVAINVAPIQFERTDFANFVHATALDFDIDPQLVAFEITESALLQNSDKHIVAIDTLRHAGSRVYIDDFGTGFSNLSYLKTLPVDAVKIDQSFVRSIDKDSSDAAIVSSIISVAQHLRLDTIAEGVETAEHAERLRALGCRYGQGYYFSKPMAATHCRALLEQLGAARRFTETVKIRAFNSVAA